MNWPTKTMTVLVLGASLIGGMETAYAQGQIYACVNNNSGTPKIVSASEVCANNHTRVVWNQQGIQGVAGIAGSQGPAGATGAAGAQGPQGNAGAAGANGLNGAQGLPGPQGETGPAGAQGPLGFAGAQGPQGPQGNAGIAGVNGQDGAQGPQGEPGPIGLQGPIGLTGASGLQGAAGPAGANGQDGATGLPGAQGPAGSTGAQGPQGVAGPIGPVGGVGAQGPAGPSRGALLKANQWAIGQPPATYNGGFIQNNETIISGAGSSRTTVIIHASGTAWGPPIDSWVTVYFGNVAVGTMSRPPMGSPNSRETLTTAFAVIPGVAPGVYNISFRPSAGLNYDSADRWNVTVMQYSE